MPCELGFRRPDGAASPGGGHWGRPFVHLAAPGHPLWGERDRSRVKVTSHMGDPKNDVPVKLRHLDAFWQLHCLDTGTLGFHRLLARINAHRH